jgi:hypothetical protein
MDAVHAGDLADFLPAIGVQDFDPVRVSDEHAPRRGIDAQVVITHVVATDGILRNDAIAACRRRSGALRVCDVQRTREERRAQELVALHSLDPPN